MGRSISEGFVEILKRTAKRLERKNPEYSHSQALDLIAKQEGYENWSLLARDVKQFPDAKRRVSPAPYSIHLIGTVARSNLEFEARLLSKRPASHYGKHRWTNWKLQGRVVGARPEVTAVITDPGELNLRHRLAMAHRVVSFMDATELRASDNTEGVFGSRLIPASVDHECIWKDATNRYIVTVEPYMHSGQAEKLQRICDLNAWQYEVLPKGYGLWLPCDASCSPDCNKHTQMLVMAPKRRGGDLQATVRAILSMPLIAPKFVTRAASDTGMCG